MQELPSTQGYVDVAEGTLVGPGDGVEDGPNTSDGTCRRRWRVADFVHEDGQPGGIGQTFGDAQPIGRPQVVEASEVADGPLTDGTAGSADSLHEGVVGVGPAVACLVQSTEEHEATVGRTAAWPRAG